jgi:predicted ArsR family transcriptional regulator
MPRIKMIARNGRMPARDISAQAGIGVRTVHRVMSALGAEGSIELPNGNTSTGYQVNLWLLIRRRGSRHIALKHLLRVLDTHHELDDRPGMEMLRT